MNVMASQTSGNSTVHSIACLSIKNPNYTRLTLCKWNPPTTKIISHMIDHYLFMVRPGDRTRVTQGNFTTQCHERFWWHAGTTCKLEGPHVIGLRRAVRLLLGLTKGNSLFMQNIPHKGLVTRKGFPFYYVIICFVIRQYPPSWLASYFADKSTSTSSLHKW